jgi:pyruvate/oxaloacetate carboxyltransferase
MKPGLILIVGLAAGWRMAEIRLVDVSLRDGNQSLWGATGLRTAHIATIAPVLGRAGFRACRCGPTGRTRGRCCG